MSVLSTVTDVPTGVQSAIVHDLDNLRLLFLRGEGENCAALASMSVMSTVLDGNESYLQYLQGRMSASCAPLPLQMGHKTCLVYGIV